MIQKLIKKYGLNKFIDLDKKIKTKTIPEYYVEKYSYPYHLVTLAQCLSEEKRPVDINEEVSVIEGVSVHRKYFSVVTLVTLRKVFANESFPKQKSIPREHMRSKQTRNSSKKSIPFHMKKKGSYDGICMECNMRFTIDIDKHPTNLCVCLKCYPEGLGFSKDVSSSGVHHKGFKARS